MQHTEHSTKLLDPSPSQLGPARVRAWVLSLFHGIFLAKCCVCCCCFFLGQRRPKLWSHAQSSLVSRQSVSFTEGKAATSHRGLKAWFFFRFELTSRSNQLQWSPILLLPHAHGKRKRRLVSGCSQFVIARDPFEATHGRHYVPACQPVPLDAHAQLPVSLSFSDFHTISEDFCQSMSMHIASIHSVVSTSLRTLFTRP